MNEAFGRRKWEREKEGERERTRYREQDEAKLLFGFLNHTSDLRDQNCERNQLPQ